MSSSHAAIRRTETGWSVLDDASKNGTWLGDERITRADLGDGAVLQVGHSFLHFRASVPANPASAPDHFAPPLSECGPLTTMSPTLERTFAQLRDVAGARVPVLVRGETGTGKELVSKAVHDLSARSGAFVAVNCGALPSTLVEAELFGFRKGSFSGATEDRPGLVRAANGGTLFLDEIGDLPSPAQAALLRVLEERAVVAIGTVAPVAVDFRLVSATHRDLSRAVSHGTFRDDLLARLTGFEVRLPPLRERVEDVGVIVSQLLARSDVDPRSVSFSLEAVRRLLTHPWPQNVRELARRISVAVVLAKSGKLGTEHLFHTEPADGGASSAGAPGDAQPLRPEDLARKAELLSLLRAHNGNVTAVARSMGKARVQIQRWMRRYGLTRDEASDG
ncbi:MAG TPA: sigma 54-interacting transcriptional regulator [Polyangiaceae bacterium]|nr:sigma 54-interacting transcriptional regulator [Polyangiaceae bacterium]